MHQNIVWVIAGLDTSGGSGIAQDNKTFVNFNVHACTILTAIVAQNNQKILDVYHPSLNSFIRQINSIAKKFTPAAIKLGFIKNKKIMQYLSNLLDQIQIPVVIDPILQTSSGYRIHNRNELSFYKNLFFKKSVFLTPNLPEAEYLLGSTINSMQKVEEAAHSFLETGIKQIIIKGGHFIKHAALDYWSDGQNSCWLSFPKINKQVRGTGCIFSSAFSAGLAKGYSAIDAFITAKMYVQQGIVNAVQLDTHHFFSHQPLSYNLFPEFKNKKSASLGNAFLTIKKIGFYPIVDDVDLMRTLISLGVKTIQLRIKNQAGRNLETIIKQACLLADKFQIQLFINDYWQLAIKYNAYGVHLGQDDLVSANLSEIQNAGLRLGVSVHNTMEFLITKSLQPSYIAIGPFLETPTKPNLKPLTLDQIKLWRSQTSIKLVAIGGIYLQHVSMLIDAGMDGIAVISALKNCNLMQHVAQWLTFFED